MATRYPVSTINGLHRAMDRLVHDALTPSHFGTVWPALSDDPGTTLAPVDAYATGDEVVILVAIPGVTAEDIEISIEKNTVTLSGDIPSVANSEHAVGASWYLHELPSGSFRRTLTLPIEVEASKAEATFENGVLRLSLPKADAAKPRQIRIQVGSGSPADPAISQPDEEATQ
ncbi:Hsp20/alpha crystallin family protein [soil metagenome]